MTETDIQVGETPQPTFLQKLAAVVDQSRQEEMAREGRRYGAAQEIAEARWMIATEVHRLEDGVTPLDLGQKGQQGERPFLADIYRDACLDRIIYGSAQWGKTEWAICEAVAAASYGMKQLMVISTGPKRDAFASGRLNPCFTAVPMYAQAIREAKHRGGDAESVRLKHFGAGFIKLIAATVPREFTSHPIDSTIIDEHQESNVDNIKLVDDRMSGSWYRGLTRIGHPTTDGTEENGNLDYLFKNSDRRDWRIPCLHCGEVQKLNWWKHIVFEKKNRHGGIVGLRPRDAEWKPGSKLDMRAVCGKCHRPMDRLSRAGHWHIDNPGHERHGWKISNLYNVNKRVSELFERYSAARYKPHDMKEFVNKQLGEPFSVDGAKITEAILDLCADGESSGIPPFHFRASQNLAWRTE